MKIINYQDIIEEIKRNIRLVVREEIKNLKCNQKEINPENVIYNFEDTRKLLGISSATLYALNRNRKIPYFKCLGKCFYSKKCILDYLKMNKIKSIAEIELEVNETFLLK
jgi:hypothetical protein